MVGNYSRRGDLRIIVEGRRWRRTVHDGRLDFRGLEWCGRELCDWSISLGAQVMVGGGLVWESKRVFGIAWLDGLMMDQNQNR